MTVSGSGGVPPEAADPDPFDRFIDRTYRDFVEVENVDDLFSGERVIYRAPVEPPLEIPAPLVAMGNLPRRRPRTAAVPLHILAIPRALVLPGKIVVDLDRGMIPIDSFHKFVPSPHRLKSAGIDPARPDWESAAAAAKRLDGFTFHGGIAHTGFGHVLLEGFSTFWPFAMIRQFCKHVLVGRSMPKYEPFLTTMGVHAPIRTKVPFLCDNLILPRQSFILDRYVSPRYFDIVRTVREAVLSKGRQDPQPVYLSRRRASKRRLLNEAEIEEIFRARGFRIVEPETLPFADQIRLMAAAPVIAGPAGSALYNAVFAKPGVRRIILASERFFSANDQLLTTMLRTPPVYLLSSDYQENSKGPMFEDWTIDAEAVRRLLPNLL